MIDSKYGPKKLTLGHLLAKVSRLVGGRMRMKLEGIGLRHAQGMILYQLWHKDGIAQNVLAQALNITPATATNTLQRMEQNGWIERRRDVKDQRIVRVYLTEKAKALRAEAGASFRELDRELDAMLTDNQHKTLMALLSKIHGRLSQNPPDSDQSGLGLRSPGDQKKGKP
jgi:DNA-binding MarR family transcriptional regulator